MTVYFIDPELLNSVAGLSKVQNTPLSGKQTLRFCLTLYSDSPSENTFNLPVFFT